MYGRSAPDEKLIKIQSSDNNKEHYLFKHGNGLQVGAFDGRASCLVFAQGTQLLLGLDYTKVGDGVMFRYAHHEVVQDLDLFFFYRETRSLRDAFSGCIISCA